MSSPQHFYSAGWPRPEAIGPSSRAASLPAYDHGLIVSRVAPQDVNRGGHAHASDAGEVRRCGHDPDAEKEHLATFVDALIIDAFSARLKFMVFAVPGSLGVLEGAYMLVFSALDLGSGLGLAFTVIRRLRMMTWSALGLLVLLPGTLATRRASAHPASVR